MKTWNSVKISWKIFCRNKFSLLIFVLSLLYVETLFYHYLFLDYAPGETLSRSSFVVQGGIFVSMVLGVQIIRLEEKEKVDELLRSIQFGPLHKILGKSLFFLALILVFSLLSLFSLFLMLYFSDLSFSSFYLSSSLYILLYWSLSFLIGGMIGSIFAFWVKGRLIYVLLIITWLLISPLNTPFILQLALLFNIENTFELINILNLGQANPYEPYHALYGYSLETAQWFKKGLWITLLFAIVFLSIGFKTRRRQNFIASLLFFLLTLPFGYGLAQEDQVLVFDREANAVFKYDYNYYKDHSDTIDRRDRSDILIKAYDIDLNTNRKFTASVDVTLQNIGGMGMDVLEFSLYHNLKVNRILYEDKQLNYEQTGDLISVELSSVIRPKQVLTLSFDYEGTSSPYFFANEQAVKLPFYFPWLPNTKKSPAMKVYSNEIFPLPLHPNSEIKYSLSYSGPEPIYTNLKMQSDGKWKGTTKNGITLIAGSLGKKTINSMEVIYPLTWEDLVQGFDEFNKSTKTSISEITGILGIEEDFNIRQVIFRPTFSEVGMPEQFVWASEDQLIISSNIYFQNNKGSLKEVHPYLTYGLVPALTWKYEGFVFEDITYAQLFNASFSFWYNKNKGIERDHSFFSFYVDKLKREADFDERDPERRDSKLRLQAIVAQKLYNLITSSSVNQRFFREWYGELKTGNNDWEYLNHKIEIVNKGMNVNE
ncbi:hypothetical protein GCM10011351_31080 [Paraliobacillus quinghaiensis]|uniref:Uncharacterized protein n=1 Tax=Paraliobacillus quinghaiensis TaxID=470815 RepID=A0A917TYR6_9BACI|nr:hypothetical protein [Paraliobacillus quinghaiensis]GGM42924.1 hypothetical protein GCM10011351_31080 [Paraliobacillus quinghaiensis]